MTRTLLFVALMALHPALFAHDNNEIHPNLISQNAVNYFKATNNPYYELFQYFSPSGIKQGTIDEDVPATRAKNHFYNPKNGGGLLWFTNAKDYGRPLFEEAVSKYLSGDKQAAYYELGRAMHLLQDMSSPAHVFVDQHILEDQVWNRLGLAIGYESWVADKYGTAPLYFPTGTVMAQPERLSFANFMDDVANATYDRLKITGSLNTSQETPSSGQLAEMFPPKDNVVSPIAYLEYVGDSGGLMQWWKIAGVGDYAPFVLLDSDWWEVNGGTAGYFYIESPQNAIPRTYKGYDNRTLQKNLAELWVEKDDLINLPINYSAGLMKYFYDLVNMPPYLKKVTLTQGGRVVYAAEWKLIVGNSELISTANEPIKPDMQLNIELEFSKRIQNVSLSFEAGLVQLKPGFYDETHTKWSTSIDGAQVINISEGVQSLLVSGTDTNNPARALDANPATVPSRDGSGAITEYEDDAGLTNTQIGGTDKTQKVTFQGIPPVVNINSNGAVCTGASGSPSTIYSGYAGNPYRFEVTDSTTGIKYFKLARLQGDILLEETLETPVAARNWSFNSLDIGDYLLTVKDVLDNTTSVRFNVVALNIELDTNTLNGTPVNTTEGPRVNSARFGVKINSSAGLKSVELRGQLWDVIPSVETRLQYTEKNGETTFAATYDASSPKGGIYKVIAKDLAGNIKTLSVTIGAVGGMINSYCMDQLECQSSIYDMWKAMFQVPEETALSPSMAIMPGAAILRAVPAMNWQYNGVPDVPLQEVSNHSMGYVDTGVQSGDSADAGGGGGGTFPRVNYYEVAGENNCPPDALYSYNGCGEGLGCITPMYSRCAVGSPEVNIPIGRYARFTQAAVNSNAAGLPMGMCPAPCYNIASNTCSCTQTLQVKGSILYASVFGVSYSANMETGLVVFPGANVSVIAATGLEVIFDNVPEPGGGGTGGYGVFDAAPEGYQRLAEYEIYNNVPFDGMAALKFDYDPAVVTTEQAALAQVFRVVTDGATIVYEKIPTSVDTLAHKIIGRTSSFSRYMVAYPVQPTAALITNGETSTGAPIFSMLADRSPVVQMIDPGSIQVAPAVRQLLVGGLVPAEQLFAISDSPAAYQPYSLVTIAYDENVTASKGINEADLSLYGFDVTGNAEKLENISANLAGNTITGRAYSPKQYYAILASTTPVPLPVVDNQAPVTAATYITTAYKPNPYLVYTSSNISLALDAYDLPSDTSVAVGIQATYYKVTPSAAILSAGLNGETTQYFSVYSSTLSLVFAEGRHLVAYGSVDQNTLYEPLEIENIYVDLTAPVTKLSVEGNSVVIGGLVYAEVSSSFTLQAVDISSNGVSSGLKRIYYLVDKTMAECTSQPTFTGASGTCDNPLYTVPFTLSQGSHFISFFSEDNVGNMEEYKSAAVSIVTALDRTAPTTYLEFYGLQEGGSGNYLNAGTTIAVTAVDSQVNGEFVSGFATAYYLIDADISVSTPLIFTQGFSLTEGSHTINYTSVDNFGNFDLMRSSVVLVDATAPETFLSINGSTIAAGGMANVASGTQITLSANDPVSNGVASGLKGMYYLVDAAMDTCGEMGPIVSTAPAGSCQNYLYSGPFSLSIGTHTVYYTVADNVGNIAEGKSAKIEVWNSNVACGGTITENTMLGRDLDCTGFAGDVLTIVTNNAVVDGNGYKIIAPSATVAVVINANNTVLRNMNLDGIAGVGVKIRGSNTEVNNVTAVGRAVGVNILADNSANIKIINSDLSGPALSGGIGVQIWQMGPVTNLEVRNNTILRRNEGIKLHTANPGSTNWTIVGNNVRGATGMAISAAGPRSLGELHLSDTPNRFNNDITNSVNGVSCRSCVFDGEDFARFNVTGTAVSLYEGTIRNSNVSGSAGTGVSVIGSTTEVNNITAIGRAVGVNILADNSTNIKILNSDLSGSTSPGGIGIQAWQMNAITDLEVRNNIILRRNEGIKLHTANSGSTNWTIVGNNVREATGMAISAAGPRSLGELHFSDTPNKFNNDITDSINGVSCRSCVFDGEDFARFNLSGTAVSLYEGTIRNSNVSGSAGTGVSVIGSTTEVNNITAIGRAVGVNILADNSTNIKILNSDLSGSTSSGGIGLQAWQMNAITDLEVRDNTILWRNEGIKLHTANPGSANWTVVGNNVRGGGIGVAQVGILLSNAVSGVDLADNVVANFNTGISLSAIVNARIIHNNIFGNGLQAFSGTAVELSYNGEGNYWGRTSAPYFIPGTDSNRLDVVDSYPYSRENGWVVNGDATPPVTGAIIGGQVITDSTTVYMVGVDSVTLTAVDDGSGLGGIYYTVDIAFSTQSATAYTAPFSLSIGTHTIYYTAFDNANNQTTVKSVNVLVWNSNVTCGGTITENTILAADLDCSGITETAVTIGADNIILDGDGYKVIAPNALRAIGGGNRKNIALRNLDLSGSGSGSGIEMGGIKDSVTENIIAHGRRYGIIFRYNNENLIVRNSDLTGNIVGLDVAGASITVAGNKLGYNEAGLELVNGSSFTISADNNFLGSTIAVSAFNITDTIIENLVLDNSKPIIVDGCRNLLFRNLDLSGHGLGIGMDVARGKDSIVENVIVHNRDMGVRFYYYAGNSVFRNNDLSENRVGLQVGGSSMTVTGNNLSGNGPGQGLVVSDGQNALIENNIAHNHDIGIQSYASGSIIRGNNVSFNKTALMVGGATVTLVGNILTYSELGLNAENAFNLVLASDNDFNVSTTAIRFSNGGNTVFENLRLGNPNPITGGGSYNLTFRNLDLSGYGSGNGIEMGGIKDSVVENVTAHGRRYGIIFRYNNENLIVRNSDLTGNIVGLDVAGASITVAGNKLGYNEAGLELVNGSSFTISADNNFLGSTIAVSAFNITDTIIENLVLDNSKPIIVDGCRNLLFRNLDLSGHGLGIGMDVARGKDSIVENVIVHNRDMGVRFYYYAGNSVFRNNDLSENRVGLQVGGSSMTVTGNNLSGNGPGQGLVVSDGQNALIENNIAHNHDIGIQSYASGSIIRGNNVSFNKTALMVYGTTVTLTGNMLTDSEAGLLLVNGSSFTISADNNFSGSTVAVSAFNITDTIIENLVLGNSKPIIVDGCRNLLLRNLDLSGTLGSRSGRGLRIHNSRDIVVENLVIHNREVGIEGRWYNANILFRSNNLSDNKYALIVGGSTMTVMGNMLRDSEFALYADSGKNLIISPDNNFSGSNAALTLGNLSDSIIENLTLSNPTAISLNIGRNILFRNLNLSGLPGSRLGYGFNINSSNEISVVGALIANRDYGVKLSGTSGDIALTNNTVAGNNTGIIIAPNITNTTITNSILWSNGDDLIDDSGAVHVNYSDMQEALVSGTSNIQSDPLFVNVSTGDFRLMAGSPCIDAGINTVTGLSVIDLGGQPRQYDGNDDGDAVIDMGAYESLAMLPIINNISPSSGAVSSLVTITGTGFGVYSATTSKIFIGTVSASIVSWTSTAIQGIVPDALVPGIYPVIVERELGGNSVRTSAVSFTVVPAISVSGDGLASIIAGAELVVTPISTMTIPSSAPMFAAMTDAGLAPAMEAFYHFEPSGVQFAAPAKLTFIFDPVHVDTSAVSIYYFDGVIWSSAPVSPQTVGLLPDGRTYIEGYITHTSIYAVLYLKAIPPVTMTVNPETITLAHNFTTVEYMLPEPGYVTLEVLSSTAPYSVLRSIYSGVAQVAGAQSVQWNGKGANDTVLGDGAYLLRITVADGLGNISATLDKTVFIDYPPQIQAIIAKPASFNPASGEKTRFVFGVSEEVALNITVKDESGNPINNLAVNSLFPAGSLSFLWDGFDNSAGVVPPGIYHITVNAIDRTGNQSEASGGNCEVLSPAYPAITGLTETPDPFYPDSPDPAVNKVVVSYNLVAVSQTSTVFPVTVVIRHPVMGVVKTIVVEQEQGNMSVQWDGLSDPGTVLDGQPAPDGAYSEEVSVNVGGQVATAYGAFSLLRNNVYSSQSSESNPLVTVQYDDPDAQISITQDPPVTSTVSAALLSQTLSGNVLASPVFDIVATQTFTTQPVLRFKYDPVFDGESLALYKYSVLSGTWIQVSTSYYVDLANNEIIVTLNPDVFMGSLFALMKTEDTSPPVTGLVLAGSRYIADGKLYLAGQTKIGFSVQDSGGSGVSSTEYRTDDGVFAAYIAPFTLPAGSHVLEYRSTDNAGNIENVKTSSITVDNESPASTIAFSSAAAVGADGGYSIPSGSSVSFTAADMPAGAASGVSNVWYSVDSGTPSVFESAFGLAVGSYTVSYWSIDNLGNTEARKTALVSVGEAAWAVKLNLDPSKLNLNSKGEAVTAKLRFEGSGQACFRSKTINIAAINGHELSNPIYALNSKGKENDASGKGGREDKDKGRGEGNDASQCGSITVKFDREALIAVLPPNAVSNITVSGALTDGRGFSASDTIKTIKPRKTTRKDGGRLENERRAGFDAQAGALRHDDDLYVLSVEGDYGSSESGKDAAAKARGIARRGIAYEFGPTGTIFDKPVTISLPFDADEKSPEKLAIAYWNEAAGLWEPLPSRRDTAARLIKADVPHFSQYQVVLASYAVSSQETVRRVRASEQGELSVSAADSEFKLGEVYVYPNPAKGGKVPTFHVEVGIADIVKIRVYTVAGQLVHERSLAGTPQTIGSVYAYEYAWAGHIASGVYYYTIEAERTGKKLKSRGKFAVVR